MATSFFTRQRWFWVAIVLLGYQIGITLFNLGQFLPQGSSIIRVISFLFVPLLSFAISAILIKWSDLPEERKWMFVSLSAFLGNIMAAASLGPEGVQAIRMSYIGIPTSFELLLIPFMNSFPTDTDYFASFGIVGLLFLIWLFLIIKAPVLNRKILHTLGLILGISILLSIASCTSLSFADIH